MQVFVLICSIFAFIFFLLLIPSKFVNFIKNSSFFFSSVIFLYILKLLFQFDMSTSVFKWTIHFTWSSFFNIYYSGGVDGFSLLFLLLTAFLIPFCILYSWNQFNYFFKELIIILFSIELLLFNFFFVSDLFFFLYFLKAFFFLCLF